MGPQCNLQCNLPLGCLAAVGLVQAVEEEASEGAEEEEALEALVTRGRGEVSYLAWEAEGAEVERGCVPAPRRLG